MENDKTEFRESRGTGRQLVGKEGFGRDRFASEYFGQCMGCLGPVFSGRIDEGQIEKNSVIANAQITDVWIRNNAGLIGNGQADSLAGHGCSQVGRDHGIFSDWFHAAIPKFAACDPTKNRIGRSQDKFKGSGITKIDVQDISVVRAWFCRFHNRVIFGGDDENFIAKERFHIML